MSLIMMILGIFGLDQYTKEKAIEELMDAQEIECLDGKIKLSLVYNKGAFLGLLKNRQKILRSVQGAAVLLVAILFIKIIFQKNSGIMKLGLACILGGALGNGYDRIKRGYVVDFFSLPIRKKVFMNLADIFIFIGSILVTFGEIISWIFKR